MRAHFVANQRAMDSDLARKSISGQAALLAWCNATIDSGTLKGAVSNFTSSWVDGRALCALVSAVDPDAVKDCRFGTVEERLAAIRTAIDALHERGVPALMDPEDFEVCVPVDGSFVCRWARQFSGPHVE